MAIEFARAGATVWVSVPPDRPMTESQSPDSLPVGTVLDGTYRLTRLLG